MSMLRCVSVIILVLVIIVFTLLSFPKKANQYEKEEIIRKRAELNTLIRNYLEKKESPLAEHTEFLTAQKHWKLLIAVSAIESQFCRRKIAFNCWGLGGDSAYRRYNSYPDAIKDANDLIEYWQNKGRWITIEDMNGHYVQPYNPNWEKVVKQIINEVNLTYEDHL